jgi:hypothetical protein
MLNSLHRVRLAHGPARSTRRGRFHF